MRRRKAKSPADLFLPGPGQPCRFVHMAVQGNEGLPFLDEAPDGDAAHVDIQGSVVELAAVQVGTIKTGLIGGRMKKKNGLVQNILAGKLFQILLDGRKSGSIFRQINAEPSFFKWKGTRVHKMRDIIPFPIF